MTDGHIIVYTTTETSEQAEKLASQLVDSFLVACVTILPGAQSYYHWENKLQISSECVLMMKTQAKLLPQLTDFIQRHHSYSEPEIVATEIIGGSESYLKWIDSVVNNTVHSRTL